MAELPKQKELEIDLILDLSLNQLRGIDLKQGLKQLPFLGVGFERFGQLLASLLENRVKHLVPVLLLLLLLSGHLVLIFAHILEQLGEHIRGLVLVGEDLFGSLVLK